MASRRVVAWATNLTKLQRPLPTLRTLLSSPRATAPSIISASRPIFTTIRQKHTIPKPPSGQQPPLQTAAPSSPPPDTDTAAEAGQPKAPRPEYELTFTCVPCGTRSTHKVSKQGYHHGSVLVTCPSCRNRHVISDHLKIFGDRSVTVEDLLRERGATVKKGILGGGGEDGDIEFWEDGSVTTRNKGEVKEAPPIKTAEDGGVGKGGEGWRGQAPGSTFKGGV